MQFRAYGETNLWRDVCHLKVSTTLSTFTPISFGDSVERNKLEFLAYEWPHTHQHLPVSSEIKEEVLL